MKIDRVNNPEGETICHVRWMVETSLGWVGAFNKEAIEALIEAATAAERERCSKVCEGFYQAGPADLPNFVANSMAIKCAAAIRGTP